MIETSTVAVWLVSFLVITEYAIGLGEPDSHHPRWQFGWKLAGLRLSAGLGMSLLATAPVLQLGAGLGLLLALLSREALRFVLRRFLESRPLDREILFFLLQWLPILAWFAVINLTSQSVGLWPLGFYQHPSILKGIMIVSALWLTTFGGAIWVRALLDQIGLPAIGVSNSDPAQAEAQQHSQGEMMKAQSRVGRIIGMLERILIFGMVLASQWTAVGFILTAKSVARYKKLEEQSFAEYYLLGTLASTLVALAAATGVNQLVDLLIP